MDLEKLLVIYLVILGMSIMFLCMCIGENRELRRENGDLKRRLMRKGDRK